MTHSRIYGIKWTSRILAILYTLSFTLLAFDVFGHGYTWQEILLALFLHMIPVILLVVATIVAWRRPSLGGVWFMFLGLVSVFFFNTHQDLITFMLISFPAFFIGSLLLWLDLGYDEQTHQKAIA